MIQKWIFIFLRNSLLCWCNPSLTGCFCFPWTRILCNWWWLISTCNFIPWWLPLFSTSCCSWIVSTCVSSTTEIKNVNSNKILCFTGVTFFFFCQVRFRSRLLPCFKLLLLRMQLQYLLLVRFQSVMILHCFESLLLLVHFDLHLVHNWNQKCRLHRNSVLYGRIQFY